MSGICGIFAASDPPPSQLHLDAMLAVLQRRGPDGCRSWLGQTAALGHALLATTPEAAIEQLPLSDPETGCTITADARIDNRGELLAALGLDERERAIGDGELILGAYRQWGEECVDHLLGDFAFAIFDPHRSRLFCARDHMGMRQLVYHHRPGEFFAFATEPEAVLAHPVVPRIVNDGRIADFLEDLEGLDCESTFFEGISRLPPAHVLTIDADGSRVRRYWRLSPGPLVARRSDEAYAEEFRTILTEAVRCRLRGIGPIGAMVSGGIDSSSVAAIASRMLADGGGGPLHSFSAVSENVGTCPETQAINCVLAMAHLKSHLIPDSALEDLQGDLIRLTDSIAEPFDGHMTMIRAIYLSAHRTGIRIMLDAAAGDVVLTSSNRIASFLRQGHMRQAWREARGAEYFWKSKRLAMKLLAAGAWVAFVPESVRGIVRRLRWAWNDRSPFRQQALARSFSRRVDLARRLATFRAHAAAGAKSDADRRAASIRHPNLVVGRERYDRVASALAIEPRDPFMDIRLIHYCLSLPESQLQRHGWPKWILRRAMSGFLPEDVVWRCGKEHLGWQFTETFFRERPGWRVQLCKAGAYLGRYVARPLISRAAKGQAHADGDEELINVYFLANWLERNRGSAR